jgi:hypothetical protein
MSQSVTDAQEKTIDGETFRVRMLDPLVALDLEVDILQTLGPAIGTLVAALLQAEDTKGAFNQLMDGIKGGDGKALEQLGEEMPVDAQAAVGDLIGEGLERAIVGLVDRLSKDKLREVVTIMTGVTEVKQGDKWPELSSIFVVFFRGKMKLLHKWLAFAIRAQYRDF